MKSSTPAKHRRESQSSGEEFSSRLSRLVSGLLLEGIGTIVAIALIASADYLLRKWIGERRFFDLIPVQWVFDTAHLLVVARLIWGVVKRFNEE